MRRLAADENFDNDILRRAIDDLALVLACSHQDEWDRQVRFLPL